MRTIQLRHLPKRSTVHALRADTKIVAGALIAVAIAFTPSWPVLGLGWALFAALFALSRLPLSILAPPPKLYFVVAGFGGAFSLLSGGSPTVGGVELGGVLEFAQLLTLGLLLVAYATLLAWTTPASDVGLGLARLVRPLKRLHLPADELATTIVLATRALPMIRDEVQIAVDARRTRPRDATAKRGSGGSLRDAVDFGASVVVGAHRRSRELARAMVARGSVTAPAAQLPPPRPRDAVAVTVAVVACVLVFVAG